MFWKLTLICIALRQAKCQENAIWNFSTCHPERNVTQAIGTNFSVTLISPCKSGAGGCDVIYLVTAGDTPQKLPVSAKNEMISGTIDLKRVAVKYTRTIVNKEYTTCTVTMDSSVNPFTVNLTSRYLADCSLNFQIASINFIECQNTSEFDVVPHNSQIAKYMDTGNISCNDNNRNGLATYRNGSQAIKTQCLANATWKDANHITCLYPIDARLHVEEDVYNSTLYFLYYQSANSSAYNKVTFDCSTVGTDEITGTKKFLLNIAQLDSPNITIHPNLNGVNVSCYFENNYTIYFNDSTATYLSTSTLIITFDPIPPQNDSFCSFSNGSIIFYSNPPADESSLTLLKGNETIASQITECCGMQYGVRGQMITPPNISTVIGNLTLRANYSGHVTSYIVTPCESVSTTTGPERYSTVNGSETESYSTITGSETESYSTINGSGTEGYSTINGSGKTDSSVIVAAAASGGVLILVIIGLIFICRWRSSKGKAKSGGDTVENINPLYGTSDDVVLESKSDEQVINPLYGTTQSEIEVYSVVDQKNKKARKAKKNQKTTKGNEDLYAPVDKGKGKSKHNRNSALEADVTEDTTYSVVDKKKRGAQKARGSIAGDVDTYAAVGRKNKKTKGAKKADKSTTIGIDTYAAVDRTNKKVKGTGDDDLHGTTSQNE